MVLKKFFVWMVWSFSKIFELMARPCSPKHGPVPFTVLKNLFVWMLCNHLKTFKFMAGPRSPTSLATAKLISRRWKINSFWCYADFQQRLNEWQVVLPQTRSRSFHGVEQVFRLVDIKLFKKQSNSLLGRASTNTAQFLSRCWKTVSSGCYAAI